MDEPLELFGESGNPSFLDLLRRQSPDLLPRLAVEPGSEPVRAPHGTTVLALRYRSARTVVPWGARTGSLPGSTASRGSRSGDWRRSRSRKLGLPDSPNSSSGSSIYTP